MVTVELCHGRRRSNVAAGYPWQDKPNKDPPGKLESERESERERERERESARER
jgi:hypothetical protein